MRAPFLDDVDYFQAYPIGSPPTFLGNIPGASDAATAITLALNSLATYSPIIFVPYVNVSSPNGGVANGVFLVDIQTAVTTNEIFDDDANPGWDYTSFVAVTDVSTATPIPAALPLFASGLGALGLIARRRKRKAALAA
jgi:hypothetical protein